LLDAPQLVDVTHQLYLGSNRLAYQPCTLDLSSCRRVTRKTELGFDLTISRLSQLAADDCRLVERKTAPECAAGIGRDTISIAAPPLPQGLPQRLAFDVPQGDVECRQGESIKAAAALIAGLGAKFRQDCLDAHRIFTDHEFGQSVNGGLECLGERPAPEGNADTLDTVIGPQP